MSATSPSAASWNEDLKLVSYCPVCETRYPRIRARILGQDGETRLFHVECGKCRHCVLALVLVNQSGASSVGLLTDLSFEDVLQFREKRSIMINDVIAVHQYLDAPDWHAALDTEDSQPTASNVGRVSRKVSKK